MAALAGLLALTGAWWALALWPVEAGAPTWLETTRSVCFGATGSGLPDGAGWAALVGQPLVMLGILAVGWRRELEAGLAEVAGSAAGRAVLGGVGVLALVGCGAAGLRIASAAPATAAPPEGTVAGASAADPSGPPPVARVPEPLPDFDLVAHDGRRLSLADFDGRLVLLTFAFAHCETLCPVVVREVLRAREELARPAPRGDGDPGRAAAAIVGTASAGSAADPVVLIVTLDPWRDRPSRLAHAARSWGVGKDAYVLSGDPAEVEAVLDAYGVGRSRDRRTGEITHGYLVYAVGPGARATRVAGGDASTLVRVGRRHLQAGGP